MKKSTLLLVLLMLPTCVQAQRGIPPFSSDTPGGPDTIDNSILNAFFGIPLLSDAGRGMPLSLALSYNSLVWQQVTTTGTAWSPVTDSAGNVTWGWQKDMPPGGSASYYHHSTQVKCFTSGSNWYWATINYYTNYTYVDPMGTGHRFPNTFNVSSCPIHNDPLSYRSGYVGDSSGYYLNAINPTSPIVTSSRGVEQVNGGGTAVDANGNFVTKTVVSSTETDWTDSLGNLALKIVYSPNNTSPTSIQYQFLDGTGASSYKTITLQLQSKNIKTVFGCAGVSEYTGTANLPSELDIPTPAGGTLKYTFSYEPTAGFSGYATGRLLKVVLPAGGSYEYDYPQLAGSNYGISCVDGTTLSMNRVVSDGTNSATWNFVRNTTNSTTTVTTPVLPDTSSANDTVLTFNSFLQETSRKIYANSPGTTLLRTINTTWASNGTPASQITILEDASTQSEVDTSFDSNGNILTTAEYDWKAGSRGTLIRTTTYSYGNGSNSNYTGRNIIGLVTSKVIQDGTGATVYRQDVAYDGSTPASCPTGVSQHDDTDYPCTLVYRGNPTSVTTYTAPAVPSGGITKNFTYDWFGNLLTAQLNCCTNRTWADSATTKYSQPDSVTSGTSPNQLTNSYTYNAYTGSPLTSTDPNNLVTTYAFDFLRRPTSISQAIGSTSGESVTYAYDDVNFTTTGTTAIDGTHSAKRISASDTLGRTLTTTLEDATSTVYSIVKNEYDLAGRAYGSSNPYTISPAYWTTTAFDVLGRPTSVTLPDTSKTTYSYALNSATATDPASKQRKSTTDAAGRLTVVTEPDVTNGNSLTLTTTYAYTVLDSLASVTTPDQSRTYTYDALGRLLTTVTPEGGTTCFGSVTGTTCNTDGYDSFDNLLKRTDARGVLTSYGYDGLNRLTGVSYNVGTSGVPATASVGLTYGSNAAQFNNGRLITMTDGPGSEAYTYNNLGQLAQLQKIIGGTTYNTQYAYNISGELTQITYPSGRVIVQNTDALGRLCSVGTSGSTCTTGTTYAAGYAYSPAQQLTGFNYGNGITATIGYSPDRLQPNTLSYAKSGTTLFGQTFSYGAAGSNNGQIQSITDTVDNGRTVAYTYDGLSRLSTATTTGSVGYPKWGLSWTYDRYANRTSQSVVSGCVPPMTCPTNAVAVSLSTNRITTSGYNYDPNGNMLNDGLNTLVYDAENHATSATGSLGTGAYLYDGKGHRVKKCLPNCTTPTSYSVYIFSGSKVAAEYDNGAAPTAPSREYIYGGAALLAKIDSSGTKYYHQDSLSNRLVSSSTGTILEQLGHYPYGESWYNSIGDKLLFTTYERDAESGNDFAMARYYASRLGRFLSLDPLAGSISDPQSLNHYAYVRNNPIALMDPSGNMECEPAGCGGGWGNGGGDAPVYLLDGVPVQASLAAVFLESGAAAICPGNNCAGWEFLPQPSGNYVLLGPKPPLPGGCSGTASTIISCFFTFQANIVEVDPWMDLGRPSSQCSQCGENLGGPNGFVTAVTDAIGIAGLAASEKVAKRLGRLGAAVSILNNPSLPNIAANLLGLLRGFEAPVAITTAFNDFLDWGINNSNPGPLKVYDGEMAPELPTQDGACLAAGMDGPC